MKNPDIDFVFFDVGGVLLHYRSALITMAEETGVPHEEWERVLAKYDDMICMNVIGVDELWNKFVEELGIEPRDSFDYLEYLTSHYTPITPTHTLVTEVKQEYEVGLLTNTYAGMFDAARLKGFIPDISYDVIVESCDVKLVKPNPQIFAVAAEEADVPPARILLIDDMEKNTESAKKCGWQAFLFDEANPEKSVDQLRTLLL
jgi:epoxide hydrolase-like predicted phosphatase